ncbi:MAG: histone deacetylase [Leptospirales bacterium]|nr:histone deacetylase [Leptospirales bacterium]
MAAGLFTDDLFLEHDTGATHPENANRLRAIRSRLDRTIGSRFQPIKRNFAEPEEVARIHDIRYIQALESFCKRSGGYLDGDTPVSRRSYDAAMLAAGAGIEAANQIKSGNLSRALLLVRPPGHHSLQDRAMGFCLFNNVAICARHLQSIGFGRVAIIDWDVHHGNGTQDAFYDDPSVYFISLHQYPFYPGTGAARETGTGKGEGFTLNIPMAAGCGDTEYMRAFKEQIIPGLDKFEPDFLLISAGFDAHRSDPLAQMSLSASSFEWMSRELLEVASRHCNGKLISFLEGGYDLNALADSVEAHAQTLLA